jgi:methionine biosynthesis protein MetW
MSRLDHQLIYELIPAKSNVLDLGCGDGSLIELLQNKQINGQGIEINTELVKQCINKGISVLQDDIDQGFGSYKDHSFDFVILNKTLQATHNPLFVLKEALRVGNKVIVSFPNFGYIVVRGQLFFGGTMPKSKDLPYEWYNTPNIHLVTIADFQRFCEKNKFKVLQTIFYGEDKKLSPIFPNLFSPYALFLLTNGADLKESKR